MKHLLFLFSLLASLHASAQQEAKNWIFGYNAGLAFNADGSITAISGTAINSAEGASSISDASGNLMLYTDGRNVYDRNHNIMPGGNYLSGTGLMGDTSTTQAAVIIPRPGHPDMYYIFTLDEPHHQNAQAYPLPFNGTYSNPSGTIPQDDDGLNNGLNYSVVDLSLTGSNGSIGDIQVRNQHLITYNPAVVDELKYKCSEKLTAVRNASMSGYWVVTHFRDRFYAFEVTASGVNTQPVVSHIGPDVSLGGYRRNAIGAMKASRDGQMIAVAHNQKGTTTGTVALNGGVYLYDFNPSTGIVSNQRIVNTNTTPYGIEFSPLRKKLYVTYEHYNGFGGLYQYDLLAQDIGASLVMLSVDDYGALQLAPDGKIYKAQQASSYLAVINNPEADGGNCGHDSFGLFLPYPTFSSAGLPNFIATALTVLETPEHRIPKLLIYPNPVKGSFSIAGAVENILNVSLLDMSGRLLRQWDAPAMSEALDISGITSGTYTVCITTQTGKNRIKIIIE
ncbi:T9SS type A sorting domain-containing protein [Flavobacterium selenitireducens]|uniref:T9SS type A sorting domain-containing protein n=1 Tax=Flavobacterium selenitireducens TaxID=2722704 RepID=UPI00168BB4C8|nr:T9SS type A sorting domain-containing protein [Flavobacterium selenitireducens]MBD3581303.1 T9SS type A sorting domain-containing protein [Flavobacterium selenitireducens]